MRDQTKFLSIGSIAILSLVSCAGPEVSAQDDSGADAVRAIVTYRERIALPADAIIELRLSDVTDRGSPRPVVAQVVIPTDGRQVPIPAELRYDSGNVRPDREYALHATILSGDRSMFTTSTPYPVITLGNPALVEMTLDRVSAEGRVHRSPENTRWRLLEVAGEPAVVAAGADVPGLRLVSGRRTVEGNTGCNLFSGPYEIRGRSLQFGELTTTLRACVDPAMNQQEGAFLTMLEATRHWRVTADTLVLSGAAGQVARFVADPPD